LIEIDQVSPPAPPDTASVPSPTRGGSSDVTDLAPDHLEHDEHERGRLVESLLDNLPVWTIVAAGVSFHYLVWATLEILSRYTGAIPKVGP
jgi:hypothetical protein